MIGGIAWTFSGTAAQAILQVATTMVLARLLTPEVFGAVAAALVVIKVAQFFTALGMSGAIIQRADLTEQHIKAAFAMLIAFGTLMWAVIQLSAPWIAAFYRIPEVENIVRLLAFTLLFNNAMEVAGGLLRRELRFRAIAIITVIGFAIGYAVIGIGLAWLGYGVYALAAAHVAQTAVSMILMLIWRPHPKSLLIRWTPMIDLLRFGSGMMAWRTASNVALEVDNLVVGRWLGAADLGLYSRAYWLAATPAVLFGRGIATVLFSALSRLQADPERLAKAYLRGVAATNVIAVPASVTIAILAPDIVLVVLGEQWTGAVPALRILAIGLLFRLSVRVSDSLTGAAGAVYRTAIIQWSYAGLVAIGAYLGHFFGIEGVAFGILGALALNFLLMTGLALHLTKLGVGDLLRTFVPGVRTTVVLGPVLLALQLWLHSLGVPALLVLVLALLAIALVGLLMLRLAPRLFLGDDGIWVLHVVLGKLPARVANLARRAVAPAFRPSRQAGGRGAAPQVDPELV